MNVSIIGGSGYVGGELLRLLLDHPAVTVRQVTSERSKGAPVSLTHPNLKERTTLKFSSIDEFEETDLIFSALPHRALMERIDKLTTLSPRIIDLSADFRLKKKEEYRRWYGRDHLKPELLNEFVYGIVELYREKMKNARYISSAGCNATAVILALHPLLKNKVVDPNLPIVAEAKCGSSEGGNKISNASHHPERSGCVRPYKPTSHRHTAEMSQELKTRIEFSAMAIEMVRGISITSHVFLREKLRETDIWKIYRKEYGDEPFIRIVKQKTGIYRYPEPKIVMGTNYCDIGFALEERRLVVISALDNLMKGAAGQAVQAMNVMCGFDERAGLEFAGLHPV
ncbi:MAG: N-acetyl-gamma-glutamyl-phosphate reductase [Euryarchaeota archaeon]|nr:N-acetyl-gamma-glutamyl-phosphate reductase [Euryarchaeota archaeon]